MRAIGITVCILTLGWYGAWHWLLADDVARVKATIDYHNTQMRAKNRAMELRVEDVYASGFPFAFRVRVEQPKFSYIVNDETYGISVDSIDLTPRDRAQGSYAVTYPSEMNVVFSISGHVPEYYTVVPDQQVALLLRAQGDSLQCSGFPGTKRCDDAAPTAPLVSFSAQLPSSMVLEITLNNQKKSAHFRLPSIDAPIYQPIPADMDNALHGFVGILRQAMVF